MGNVRRAFTLIELLVVIAIIAILAAILFPVFAQAKTAAKKANCISNLKQLATAYVMYADDFDDTPPLAFAKASQDDKNLFDPVRKTASWHNLVQPYAKNWGFLICPDYPPFFKADPRYKDPFIAYGGPPNAAASGREAWSDRYYLNRRVYWQGLLGAMRDNGWTSQKADAPSLNMSAINTPGEMTIITDSSAPDWWLLYAASDRNVPDNTFGYYIRSWYPEYGSQGFGPLARHLMKKRNYIGYRSDVGQVVMTAADTHARALDLFQYLRTKKLADGREVFVNLWPAGE